ncbi:MAG: efflux RND transporter periplasmic adaptor subunit [Rhodobacteraceae bacterium]|nr:efflux RND transporter periplasmic adaptor subunit [Paracoccaceae bacterium]
MRIVPILTAIIVCAAIYMLILERDLLMGYAGVTPALAEEPVKDTAVENKPPVSVLVLKSTAQAVDRGIVLRGQTEAFRLLNVSSENTGQVISQPLRKGTLVEEGELLCQLDPGTKQASLAEAKARRAEAEANNKASATLVQKGYASETTAISRLAALEAAEAGVSRAMKEIEQLEIRAPFSGLLESDAAEFGSLLQPGALCATLIALDPIKLVGYATEQQVSRISVGGDAGALLIGGEEVRGRLSFISRSADQLTRTFRVEIMVPNPLLKIRDGSTAEIFIALDGEKGHLLPQSALTLDDAGRLGIRAVEDGRAVFHTVSIINDTVDGVWVTALPEQVDVIVVGQEFVVSGRRVTVTYKDSAS